MAHAISEMEQSGIELVWRKAGTTEIGGRQHGNEFR